MGHADSSRDPLGQQCLWDPRVHTATLIHGIFPSAAGSMSASIEHSRLRPKPVIQDIGNPDPPTPEPGNLLPAFVNRSGEQRAASVCIRVPPRARPVPITPSPIRAPHVPQPIQPDETRERNQIVDLKTLVRFCQVLFAWVKVVQGKTGHQVSSSSD
jgi:hypothetical protein